MTNIPQSPPPPSQDMSSDTKNLAMLSHLLGIVPGIGCVGPLVIWLTKKQDHPFIESQSKEALNFELTVLIGWVAIMIVTWIPFIGWCLGPICWLALFVGNLVLCLMGAMKAKEGIAFKYPVNLRLVK